MGNYTPTTNFAAKDALASGTPAKLIVGAQFSTEFTNIATAIASKFDNTPFLRTAAEIIAGVTPTNLAYPEGADQRYGALSQVGSIVDDTAAITQMIQVANAVPGRSLFFRPVTYGISALLPDLTASGTIVQGFGPDGGHNGGTFPIGTSLKWIGSSNAGTMWRIGPTSGSANYLTGLKITGLTFDCNAGTLGNGLLLQSFRYSEINVGVKEASTAGMTMGCVATLTADPCDIQFNKIRYVGYQNSAAGISLVLTGTVTANTSLNYFEYVDIFHTNAVAVNSANVDSNVFIQVRLFHNGSGSATKSWTFQGSNTIGVNARSEQIFRLSATLPVYALGTGLTFPAGQTFPIKIYNLDKNNGDPDPIMDLPGQVVWSNDSTPITAETWTAYTPVVTGGGSGYVAGGTPTGQYLLEPRKCTVQIVIPVTTAGTGSGNLVVTLPVAVASSAFTMTGCGFDNANGNAIMAVVQASGTTANVYKTTNAGYPAVNGSSITITLVYETA